MALRVRLTRPGLVRPGLVRLGLVCSGTACLLACQPSVVTLGAGSSTTFGSGSTSATSGGTTGGWSTSGGTITTTTSGGTTSGGSSSGGTETIPSAGDPSEELFSDDVLPEFEIELSDSSFSALLSDPYTYVPGALIYQGERYEPVGIRTKGENSWQPINAKPSLKVRFDYDVDGDGEADGPTEFYGLERLTFQNMDNDYTMMHERLAYRLYRAAGIPSARATHALITLNGRFYGVYTNLETVDKRMMGRWFEDDDGPLFEQWDVEWQDAYIPYFELEYGEDDRTNLQGTADALEMGGELALAELEDHLSMEAYLAYWAVGSVVGQFDAYPYSDPGDDCHVYDDPTSGVLHYVPHGADETFYYPDHDVQDHADGLLSLACVAVDDCEEAYQVKVWDMLELSEAIDQVGYFDMVAEQIGPHIAEDDNKPYSTSDVMSYQSWMRDFITQREAYIRAMIGSRP